MIVSNPDLCLAHYFTYNNLFCYYSYNKTDNWLQKESEATGEVVFRTEAEALAKLIGAVAYVETSAIEQLGLIECFTKAVSRHTPSISSRLKTCSRLLLSDRMRMALRCIMKLYTSLYIIIQPLQIMMFLNT